MLLAMISFLCTLQTSEALKQRHNLLRVAQHRCKSECRHRARCLSAFRKLIYIVYKGFICANIKLLSTLRQNTHHNQVHLYRIRGY